MYETVALASCSVSADVIGDTSTLLHALLRLIVCQHYMT